MKHEREEGGWRKLGGFLERLNPEEDEMLNCWNTGTCGLGNRFLY
jgi:hypothetical protein